VDYLLNNRPQSSDIHIFRAAQQSLEVYDKLFFLRKAEYKKLLGAYDSMGERDTHLFLKNEISPLFINGKFVADAIGKKVITIKDENGNDVDKKVHHLLHFDCYLELTNELREMFGLDDKWKAIAVEYQGVYWHSEAFPKHLERDKFKKTICEQESIIRIEIWENIDKTEWLNKFIEQLNEQAGTELTENDFELLKNYLGNLE